MRKKYHVKRDDNIVVISGKWKGEEGKVLAVNPKKDRVILEMPKLSPQKQELIGRRTIKKSQENPKGGLIERAISTHVSNVKLLG